MTREFYIALVVLCVGFVTVVVGLVLQQRTVLPDGIVLCEVTGGFTRCEMIAGAEER